MIWHQGMAPNTPPHAPETDRLALAAVEGVRDGMVVGLGAGKTASRAVRALAARVAAGDLTDLKVVPASDAAEAICLDLGLTLAESAAFERLDLLIDGADEVDRDLRMLKGSRGAVTRERILAAAAARRIYMVTESKVSLRIGTNSALALALLPFGVASTRQLLRRLGLIGVMRREIGGGLLVTDNGNLILDAEIPDNADINRLATDLWATPGVVEHGLFLHEADTLLIERHDATVERLERR